MEDPHDSRFRRVVHIYPNPFNAGTRIEFSQPESGEVAITIHNMLGQKIRDLMFGRVSSGVHSVIWNGSDNADMTVSSGIYLVRLQTESFVTTIKVLAVR